MREHFAAAAPQAPADLYPCADHQRTTGAQTARGAFLAEQLGLAA